MKKTILTLTALILWTCGSVMAAGISFSDKAWKDILAQAKREKKLVFLDAYATWCGPCKYLQRNVFTDQTVGKFYNDTFVNAKLDMEEGEGATLSEELGVTVYPTLFFVNGDGQVVHKYVGAMEVEKFLELGKDAINPEKQFYTVKAKANAGVLEPKALHTWIHAAEKLKDPDTQEIIGKYLTSGKYAAMSKDMLQIVLDHAEYLTEAQLNDLVKQKAEIMKVMEFTEEKYQAVITKKVRSYALKESLKDSGMDFNQFRQIVNRYSPAKAALETQKMKVEYYFSEEEYSKGLDELATLISTPALRLTAEDMSSLVVEYSDKIAKANRSKEFVLKVQKFKLQKDEAGQEFYKDFALLAIYYSLKNETQVTALATKIKKYSNLPEEIKGVVEQLL